MRERKEINFALPYPVPFFGVELFCLIKYLITEQQWKINIYHIYCMIGFSEWTVLEIFKNLKGSPDVVFKESI